MTKIILHREDRDMREHLRISQFERDSQVVERREIIAYDSDRHILTQHDSRYMTGIGRHGARYWKWVTDNATSVGINKRGQFYTRSMWGGEFRRTRTFVSDGAETWNSLKGTELLRLNYHRPFYRYARQIFDSDFNVGDVYPIAKNWDEITGFGHIPQGMPELKETDPKVFIERLFGKHSYRKDLAKAVFEINPRNLWMVNLTVAFKGKIPVDWIIRFLRENGHQQFRGMEGADNRFNGRRFKFLLPKMDERSYRHLMFHVMEDNEYRELVDIMQRGLRWGAHDIGNFGTVRSFHDIHEGMWGRDMNYGYGRLRVVNDLIGRAYQQHLVIPDIDYTQEIPVIPQAEKLNESLMVELPKTVQDLYDWSNEFGNCISSYARDVTVKNAYTILGKIVHEGKSVACFEIRNGNQVSPSWMTDDNPTLTMPGHEWELRQLLGKYNQTLPRDIRSIIEHMMREKGVHIPKDYWGSTEHRDVLAEF